MTHDPSILLWLDRHREAARALFCRVTTEHGTGYQIGGAYHRSGHTRGRNGGDSLALYRMVVTFRAMAQAGHSRADMMALVAHQLAVIEELCPAADVDVPAAILRAQAADTSEDYVEVQALLDPRRTDRLIEAKELHIADEFTLIAAFRAQQGQSREWRAAA